MKRKEILFLLGIAVIVTVPYVAGLINVIEMLIGAFVGITGGLVVEWFFRPRKMTILFENKFFRMGKTSKGISFRTSKNQIIIDRISTKLVVRDQIGKKRDIKLQQVDFSWKEAQQTLSIHYSSGWYKIELQCIFRYDSPEISFITRSEIFGEIPERISHNKEKLRIQSERLVFHFPSDLRLKELFLKNRTRRKRMMLGKIWLDKQGLSIGRKERSFNIYHTPGISSMIYGSISNSLTIFTDHEEDHRFNITTIGERNNRYSDCSQTIMQPGDVRLSTFECMVGYAPLCQPLIWLHPDGQDATLIWSEHPDNNNLAATKAVAIGNSELTASDKPVAGFAKHGIPVTKGVFFTTDNKQNISLFDHEDSDEYRILIEKLHKDHDYEIVPHSTASHFGNRELAEETLFYFKKYFNNKNWIDHSGGINPIALSADGTEKKSENYIIDILEKSGVKYSWHYGSELKYLKGFDILDDAHGIDLLKSGQIGAKALHTPLYWKHQSKLNNIVTWKTMALGRLRHFPVTGLQWLVFMKNSIKTLIKNHGVCIIHDYPAWSYKKRYAEGNGIYIKKKSNNKETFYIDPDFDKLLCYISFLKKEQVLCCTTVDKFLDYQTSMEQLRFGYHDKNSIKAINAGKEEIRAILVIPALLDVQSNRLKRIRKTNRNNLYCLHLKPEEIEIINIKQ